MVDIFLIVVSIIFSVLAFVVGWFIIVAFQQPEEKWGGCYSWFAKLIATLAFGTAALNVLLLPLDALNRSTGNTLKIEYMCWIFTLISMALVFVVLPFTITFYENMDEEDHKHPFCCAFFSIVPFIFFVVVFFLILWFAVGRCEVPVMVHRSGLFTDEAKLNEPCTDCISSEEIWKITPSALVYCIALIGFLGYILFLVEGGCGVITLPFGLFGAFINRPRGITSKLYHHAKDKVNQWANELLEESTKLKERVIRYGRNHRKVRKDYAKFMRQVDALEDTYITLERSYKPGQDASVLWGWIALFLGFISIILTIVWIAHVVFYYLLDMHPVLNELFVVLDNAFPYGAVIFYGVFVYYLFWAVLDGTTEVGTSFLFIKIHPMERKNTPMTSILFNCVIMLFASFGIALFCSMNFHLYTRLSSLDMIYGTQMTSLAGLKYVWKYGIYAWFGFMFLGLVWKAFTIRKRDRKIEILRECFDRHDVKSINKKYKSEKKGEMELQDLK